MSKESEYRKYLESLLNTKLEKVELPQIEAIASAEVMSVKDFVSNIERLFMYVSVMGNKVRQEEVETACYLFIKRLTTLVATRDAQIKAELEKSIICDNCHHHARYKRNITTVQLPSREAVEKSIEQSIIDQHIALERAKIYADLEEMAQQCLPEELEEGEKMSYNRLSIDTIKRYFTSKDK